MFYLYDLRDNIIINIGIKHKILVIDKHTEKKHE